MTGGGTGGHLYPVLAVADALKKLHRDTEILFVGSDRGLESKEVPEAGFRFHGLKTVPFPRRFGPKTPAAALALGRAVLATRKILREFAPQVVFSSGGYASAPVAVAARLERAPLVLQEQNSIPGRTNRVASRFAAEVHLAYPSARVWFPRRGHLRLSGNPIREQILSGQASRALRLFRLEEGRRTVLVFGGSQGAHSINEALLDALPRFDGREDVQFLIQCGDRDYEAFLARCRDLHVKTWVRRFIANMGDAYALADLVICRAGALTISELAACGLPSILVPYPYAADNHQKLNAELMVEGGAAVLLPDHEMNGTTLASQAEALLAAPVKLREMSVNALRIARPQAADKIARALLRFRPASEIPPEPEFPRSRGEGRGRSREGPRGGSGRSGPGGPGGSRRSGAGRAGGPGDRPQTGRPRQSGPPPSGPVRRTQPGASGQAGRQDRGPAAAGRGDMPAESATRTDRPAEHAQARDIPRLQSLSSADGSTLVLPVAAAASTQAGAAIDNRGRRPARGRRSGTR